MAKYLLKNGSVIDPVALTIKKQDILIDQGFVKEIAPTIVISPEAEVIDLADKIITPGLIDPHVHIFGALGFSDPESIGLYSGVTGMIDAGGPGFLTYREFRSLLVGCTETEIYCYLMARGAGIAVFGVGSEGNVRDLGHIAISDIVDDLADPINRGIIKGIKVTAFGNLGVGNVKMAKGLAEMLDLPLYVHVGDFKVKPKQTVTQQILPLLSSGDIVTHLYTSAPGNLFPEGGPLPELLEARNKGVLFDIAFGSYNFSFDVARRGLDAGITPDMLSSDLQMVNITGPTFSLSNVMSIFLALGFDLPQVVRLVTVNPIELLGLKNHPKKIQEGAVADISILSVEKGDWTFRDTNGGTLKGTENLTPVMVFKNGNRVICNLERGRKESNWRLQVLKDRLPAGVEELDKDERIFLKALRTVLQDACWEGMSVHNHFHEFCQRSQFPLSRAAKAIHRCFFEGGFTPQVGWFLANQDRNFVMQRLAAVSS